MKDYQFPLDGSVVIIEDKIEEAMPLIKLLSQKGIAATYYTGADHELPTKPIQKIRLAFVDIQLFGPSDPHSYAQNILSKLDSIISDNNGPYILIVWSKTDDINAETLEREVMSWTKPPVIVLRLNKTSFFTTFVDESMRDSLIEKVDSSLRTRFQAEDMSVVNETIKEFYQSSAIKIPKRKALQAISKELLFKLEGMDILQLFAVWENCINKTSGDIVKSFSSLHNLDEYWQSNLRSTMYRMAHTQLGKIIDSVDSGELIKNAIKTLNYIFLGTLENATFKNNDFLKAIEIDENIASFSRNRNGKKYEIRWAVKSREYQLYIEGNVFPSGAGAKKRERIYDLCQRGQNNPEIDFIKHIIDDYLSIEPDINTKLFVDFNLSINEGPGVIYRKSARGQKKKRILLGNYFEKESIIFKQNNDQTYVVKDEKLKEIIFVELNVVPSCDHAQEKWVKAKMRLLPGVIFPGEYLKDLKKGDSFYKAIPLLKIDNKCYQCIFDFRLLKSEDIPKSIHRKRKPWFKIRNEVLADILSRLSSHASRVGVAFIE